MQPADRRADCRLAAARSPGPMAEATDECADDDDRPPKPNKDSARSDDWRNNGEAGRTIRGQFPRHATTAEGRRR
jgi:hypothetical protein